MNAEQKRLSNLNKLFGVYGATPGAGNPGFSIQKRFITVGNRSVARGVGYRQVKWAMEVIRLYNDGRRHGYIPTYPAEAGILTPRHRYKMVPPKKVCAVRPSRVVAKSKPKGEDRKAPRRPNRGPEGKAWHRKVGRVAAKNLLLNKQQRDPAWRVKQNRQALVRRRRKRICS